MSRELRVLVACEFSGVVRNAFRKLGHDAYSCDLLPARDGSKFHIQGNILDELQAGKWDMMIAHPPCTYICVGGNNWLNRKPEWRDERDKASDFFMKLIEAPFYFVAVENPIGVMSTRFRKPDQIVHPYHFGHDIRKDTCLWLKNLPKLSPTEIIPPPYRRIDYWSNKRKPDGYCLKSITYQGIADAMAIQWGGLVAWSSPLHP